jgi:hypothetical protein
MSNRLDELVARRDLLVARGAVQRARAALEVASLRESLNWRQSAAALTGSPRGRSALLGVALFLLSRGRAGRILRAATLAIAVFRLARSFVRSRDPRRDSGA